MRKLILTPIVTILVALPFVGATAERADGHFSGNCSHSVVYNSNSTIRERYDGSYNSGGYHYHKYSTWKQYPSGLWYHADNHVRKCARH